MKNLIKHLPLLALIFISLSYTACTSENADEPTPDTSSSSTPSESPEDNLPEEARAFVGYWEKSTHTRGYHWLFFDDGVCWGHPVTDYDNPSSRGYWTYNPATTILATTIDNQQYTITLSNSKSWTGIYISTNGTRTYNRVENLSYMNEILKTRYGSNTWKENNENTLTLNGSSISATFDIKEASGITISEDDNPDDYTFNYELRKKSNYSSNYYTVGSGTVTLLNPTKSTGHKLVFTGDIDKTLSRAENE